MACNLCKEYELDGKVLERYRIIKLLEGLKGDRHCDECESYAQMSNAYLDNIIELIKGENK